CLHDVELPPTF
nr:immunoglobulin light chain junction region [Macaca mulatta]MOX24432.1 immunoglobulin light chain junction region [Macaca mulatta]MOX24573.1 immunoglobulin light chain junction region [Macaca mulatta]MOX24837.1 immunoglobulin light chain junction region [Macaca mulatta]MOX25533.1 immunoglobulin light chain junction region [Macaca mulatta]